MGFLTRGGKGFDGSISPIDVYIWIYPIVNINCKRLIHIRSLNR